MSKYSINEPSEISGQRTIEKGGKAVPLDEIVDILNMHDELVCMLERVLESACDDYACSEDFFDHVREFIGRAKGE